MSKFLSPFETFATVKSANGKYLDGSFNGPVPILHETQYCVWVACSIMDELLPEMKKVSTSEDSGLSPDGGLVVSVPKFLCTFHTEEEASNIQACMDADEQLLSYAK